MPKSHGSKKGRCKVYPFPHFWIGHVFGECSKVFGEDLEMRRVVLQGTAKLLGYMKHDQSRYWGRKGRHLLGWWRFQAEGLDEPSRFVEFDGSVAFPHFGYAAGGDVESAGDLRVLDPPVFQTRQQFDCR